MYQTAAPAERALLVGIERGGQTWSVAESLAELERLTQTAGAEVVGSLWQRLRKPNPRTFIGRGKVAEIRQLVMSLQADVVIFDDELTPTQQNNLEKELAGAGRGRRAPDSAPTAPDSGSGSSGALAAAAPDSAPAVPAAPGNRDIKIIDRTALILDIFALHARSREGRLQVRLAQNHYLLPRLRGMWEHLAAGRMGGGVGSRFGEGESQLEVDRRMVRKRIDVLKRELAKVHSQRQTQRKARAASGVWRVALAGYTNAGKSSLLNRLTDADVLAYDALFATLDSTTRKLMLTDGREMTLTDTVGFIQKLPTTLVEAFRSTLDEITDADLILHVCDATSEQIDAQSQAVSAVLEQIGAHGIPRLTVLNKADLLNGEQLAALRLRYPQAVVVSARTGSGTEVLLERVEQLACATAALLTVQIPFTQGAVVQLAHQHCTILAESYDENGTLLQVRVPQALTAHFQPYAVQGAAD
ncbi:MAG: GTPase HflX [Coriobacteriales bacterium]|jgi:GTP-binding protein HflX|nr:GTPase HflX [Coriobacteriales bacterium]